MKRLLLLLSSLALSANAAAAGKVNYLNVNGDIVHFATDAAKAVASPGCVVADTSERFTMSLQTESGRGMYSLLVTAMASNLALEVESALDCAVSPGIERALGVSVAPVIEEKKSDKVSWAGYTNPVQGNFRGLIGGSPLYAASQLCQDKYPGSRVMLWKDYLTIMDSYPDTYQVWFLDAVSSVSASASKFSSSFSSNAISELLILKNGMVKAHTNSGSYPKYSGESYARYASCQNWGATSNSSQGFTMTVQGWLDTENCQQRYRLACVTP